MGDKITKLIIFYPKSQWVLPAPKKQKKLGQKRQMSFVIFAKFYNLLTKEQFLN